MVAYAPNDDPQIAIAGYNPHGYSGSYCSLTVRDIIDYYLEHSMLDTEDFMAPANSLAY